MAQETYDLKELRDRAEGIRVAVVGAGVGGLTAALEFAKLGMHVTVVEASDRLGGAVFSGEVAGLALDLGAESFATRGGHVAKLIDELGLADDVVDPGTGAGGAWVAGVPGVGAAPLPTGGVLGIPANPFADDVRRVIGWGGAWRAYLDRIRPVLTIGHAHSLGRLVEQRLGSRVLERLVAPVTTGVYSATPDLIDPDVAAPGLNQALTRTGSLTGAVAELAAARRSAPGGAVQGIRGGMGRLVDALADRIRELGGEIMTGSVVHGIDGEPGAWALDLGEAGADAEVDDEAPVIEADAVVVATEEGAARRLLAPLSAPDAPLAPEPERPGPVVHVVSLVIRDAALDAKPRGTGVLTVPGSHRAKALTHATAKWQWVADAAGSGVHVVRVSFGSATEQPTTAGLGAQEIEDLAREEASALLGVPLAASAVVGSRVARFTQSQPAATLGLRDQTAQAREAIARIPGVGAVGAWLAGTGLAQVVPDAIAEAERVRRALLFADEDDA